MRGLQLENLQFGPNRLPLGTINWNLENGRLYALTGRNGTGKSTLLKTISGLIPPLNGKISLEGEDLVKKSPEFLAKKIGLVLTKRPDVRGIDVLTLLQMGRFPHRRKINDEEQNDILRWAEKLQLTKFLDTSIDLLSDGEFQRAMIGRVLIQETPVILLDEPTAFLDFVAKEEILELLKSLAESSNKIVIFSSHDLALVNKYAHHEFRLGD